MLNPGSSASFTGTQALHSVHKTKTTIDCTCTHSNAHVRKYICTKANTSNSFLSKDGFFQLHSCMTSSGQEGTMLLCYATLLVYVLQQCVRALQLCLLGCSEGLCSLCVRASHFFLFPSRGRVTWLLHDASSRLSVGRNRGLGTRQRTQKSA